MESRRKHTGDIEGKQTKKSDNIEQLNTGCMGKTDAELERGRQGEVSVSKAQDTEQRAHSDTWWLMVRSKSYGASGRPEEIAHEKPSATGHLVDQH